MEDEDDARSLSVSTSQSQSPSPPPSPPPQPVSEASPATQPPYSQPNGRTMEPVTVAAPPQRTLTLALPIQNPRPVPGGGGSGGGGGREDCWSEGATSALIDAWGERYLELSRGNLKQKQWQEVADAVSSRDDYTKPPKTDVQCKNRIDTLKKKYKLESSKISPAAGAGSGSGSATSSWPFFNRLDLLIGPNHKPVAANPPPPPTTNTKASAAARPSFPQRHRTQHPGQQNHKKRSPSPSSSKSGGLSADSADSFPPETANGRKRRAPFPEAEPSAPAAGKVVGLRELARAIARFGEVYQRVESSKLQQAIEMEKQRMGFARELDLQRTQFFMKTQMELSQLNHSGSSGRRRKRGTGAAASAATTSNHNNNNSNSSS